MGLYQGRIFWSGSVSLVDGRIEEIHTLQEAQAADFHHTFYFSPEQASKIDDGECGFFWITEDGEVGQSGGNPWEIWLMKMNRKGKEKI